MLLNMCVTPLSFHGESNTKSDDRCSKNTCRQKTETRSECIIPGKVCDQFQDQRREKLAEKNATTDYGHGQGPLNTRGYFRDFQDE